MAISLPYIRMRKTSSAQKVLVGLLLIGIQVGQSDTGQAEQVLTITSGKGAVVDTSTDVRRVSISNSEIAEAVVISPREILVNGKTSGETSMVVWRQAGDRLLYTVNVVKNTSELETARREIREELPGQPITLELENNAVFLRGVASNLTSANRALAIANSLGKCINLLKVNIPPTEPQILLKIRFANVDRSASQSLGLNFFSNGATNTVGSVSTQQFSPPRPGNSVQGGTRASSSTFTLSDALNIFLFRPDLNLGATIQALAARNLLQILAEPNLLTLNEHPASFLAGGEFPFPTLQGGGAGLGAVTIQFREFGIRLNFTPSITPRGTIHLKVAPEVSSLDYANSLVVQGSTIPALATRRVSTDVELEDGQSFAIAGLLDNRVTQNLSKIPGLGDVPLFGKLFQSRQLNKSNTELIIVVTPEVVKPLLAGQALPSLNRPADFLPANSDFFLRSPAVTQRDPATKREEQTIPVEDLIRSLQPMRPELPQQHDSLFSLTPGAMQPAQLRLEPTSTKPVQANTPKVQ